MSLAVNPDTGRYPSVKALQSDMSKLEGGINNLLRQARNCSTWEKARMLVPHIDAYIFSIEDVEDAVNRSFDELPCKKLKTLERFTINLERLRSSITHPPIEKPSVDLYSVAFRSFVFGAISGTLLQLAETYLFPLWSPSPSPSLSSALSTEEPIERSFPTFTEQLKRFIADKSIARRMFRKQRMSVNEALEQVYMAIENRRLTFELKNVVANGIAEKLRREGVEVTAKMHKQFINDALPNMTKDALEDLETARANFYTARSLARTKSIKEVIRNFNEKRMQNAVDSYYDQVRQRFLQQEAQGNTTNQRK